MAGLSDAIGELFVKVSPDTTGFGAKTAAQTSAQAKGAQGRFGNAGKLVGGAMVAGAVGAFAKGVGDFAQFERGMNEVFTLLPGTSQATFDAMEEDLKDFSKATGNATENVIPALYDSLSAGVPQDNVFAFLEDANKFAKAGATDLGTAVDGLTSVVNAYGMEAEDAGRVSDALFTAVKLGKTTVEELSSSIFQVAPIAASFGVSMEDVSASFATLTAQGTPTKVAATQMKAAISELGKQGTKANKAFVDFAGKTFPEFIAEGGTMVDAAAIMSGGAEELGLSVVDMFGSIEAGQAIVGLSSDLEKSAANLDAVNDAAGATDEAFQQMEKGIGPTMDKLKATIEVAFIDIGDAIAPVIMELLPILADFLGIIGDLPGPVLAAGLAGIALAGGFLALAGPILKAIKVLQLLNVAMLANPWVLLIAAVVLLAVIIYKNWDTIKETVGDALDWIEDKVSQFSDWLVSAWEGIYDALEPILNVIQEIWSFAFNAMSTFVETWIGRLTALWENFSGWMTTAFQALSDFIMPLWNALWDNTVGKVTGAWDSITSTIQVGVMVATDFINMLLAPIGGIEGALNRMQGVFSTVWDAVKGIMQDAYNFVVDMAKKIGDAVSDALGPVGAIAEGVGGVLGTGARILGFDDGGVVPGPIGSPQMVLAHGGETILPTHKDPGAGGSNVTVNLNGAVIRDDRDVTLLARELARETERVARSKG